MGSMTQISAQYWSFLLGGMVDIPLPLSYNDLLALPTVEIDCAILHAGRSLNGPYMHEACWRGVPLSALLDEVTIQPGARYAHLHAANGYRTSITTAALEKAILAFQMNGEALTLEQGCPVRLIVPGLYGYKMPRQIQRVLLASEPLLGTWERRGWSLNGQVQITSVIRAPRYRERAGNKVKLTGVAFAGELAVSQVEISINDSPWMPVPFSQPSAQSFARWSVDWMPPMPGDHTIRVRAADSAGYTQPNPHSIIVRVQE